MTRRRGATSARPMAAALGIALALAIADGPACEETLVGRWDAEARSRGGLGSWLEFRVDGTVWMSIGAMVDGRYRLGGDELTLLPDTAHAEQATATVRVTADTLTMAHQTMRRVGARSAGDPPDARGIWTYPHHTGVPAYEQFTRDGRHLLRIPMVTHEGRVDRVGRTLRIEWRSGDVSDVTIRLEDDTLVLRDGVREVRYRREEGSIPGAVQRGP